MPQAATHIIIALILGSLYRDHFIKNKESFSLHYILILGLGALLPDLDVALYWILYWFGFSYSLVHRPFTHNLFFPLIFVIFSLITWKYKNRELGKHHLKVHMILLMIAFGILIHFALDASLAGWIMPFYPFSNFAIGNSPFGNLPEPLNTIFFPCLDAALIVLWLIYIEWKHKISDFI